jgi:diguanylate cyclase (GGDEF)-like protein/PAS domain S-box-containing protein
MTALPDTMMVAALEATSFAVLITDTEPRILAVNRAFSDVTGFSEQDVIGRNPSILSSGHQDPSFYRDLWHSLQQGGRWSGEIWNRRRDGSLYPEWLTIDAIRDDAGTVTNYVGIFNDISARKEHEAKLEWQALHDPLTCLPNRSLLVDRLGLSLEQARRSGHMVGVLALDLDGFKAINDGHGHAAGDALLREVGGRILESVRAGDTVARMGGDEFVVLCPNIEGPRIGTMVANRMLKSLRRPVTLEKATVTVGASIGVAFFPLHGGSASALLQRADEAMYAAKHAGKARIELAA